MPRVSKTIHKAEYPVFLELLVQVRKWAGLTQVELATRAGWSQPYISSVERGALRLDTLQLLAWLHACGTDLGTFGTELEKRLRAFGESRRSKRAKLKAKLPKD